MKKLLLALGILALICSPAMAGKNANGAMVVHTDNSIVYTGTADYCLTTVPGLCEELNPNGTGGLNAPQVVWLMAAFRPEASPGVTTIQFGITHNLPDATYFPRYAPCGPQPIELPDGGWPVSGFGNLVAYGAPVYDHVFKFYWFALYIDGPTSYFGTRTYPNTNEAKFVDDSNPPIEDLCFNFGMVKWDGTGINHCPEPPQHQGACCLPDGSCHIVDRPTCDGLGGYYVGDDTVCDPNPCPQPGACCFPTGECQFVLEAVCAQMGGVFHAGVTCTPNPCPAPEACCFQDGHCEMQFPDVCAQMGGTPMGAGVTCDPNPCAHPGACCFDDGSCQFVLETVCTQLGGTFHGDWTCDPNQCPITPTRPSTWGQIKANYR